ncbi:hypothetical protein ACFVVQ_22785 [Paenibacillus chitinolyticus]|uniref:hypothetical protein n=1 Tax=Paenibacillus chitinolyticus TaxID=79263 RepID=UPI0036DA8C76
MNTFENLDSDIPDLVKKIVVPLRGKEIDEHSFAELFKKLVYLQGAIKDEPVISRKIAGYLFYLYTQLEIQQIYANNEKAIAIQDKRTRLLTYLRQIFGDIRENG